MSSMYEDRTSPRPSLSSRGICREGFMGSGRRVWRRTLGSRQPAGHPGSTGLRDGGFSSRSGQNSTMLKRRIHAHAHVRWICRRLSDEVQWERAPKSPTNPVAPDPLSSIRHPCPATDPQIKLYPCPNALQVALSPPPTHHTPSNPTPRETIFVSLQPKVLALWRADRLRETCLLSRERNSHRGRDARRRRKRMVSAR